MQTIVGLLALAAIFAAVFIIMKARSIWAGIDRKLRVPKRIRDESM